MRATEKQCVGVECSDGSAAAQCSHMSGGTSWHRVHHPLLEPCLQQRASSVKDGWCTALAGGRIRSKGWERWSKREAATHVLPEEMNYFYPRMRGHSLLLFSLSAEFDSSAACVSMPAGHTQEMWPCSRAATKSSLMKFTNDFPWLVYLTRSVRFQFLGQKLHPKSVPAVLAALVWAALQIWQRHWSSILQNVEETFSNVATTRSQGIQISRAYNS